MNNLTKAKNAIKKDIPTKEREIKLKRIKHLNLNDLVQGVAFGDKFTGKVTKIINTTNAIIKRDDKTTDQDVFGNGNEKKGWSIEKHNKTWRSGIEPRLCTELKLIIK